MRSHERWSAKNSRPNNPYRIFFKPEAHRRVQFLLGRKPGLGFRLLLILDFLDLSLRGVVFDFMKVVEGVFGALLEFFKE